MIAGMASPHDFRRIELNKTVAGLFLVALSILLGSLFFAKGYHDFYWSHPAIFIVITIIVVSSALCGSFLVGNTLHLVKVSQGLLRRFLTGIGTFVSIAGGLLGLVAISMATAISCTGYWGNPAPYEYSGDYLIMGLQIFVLRVSIPLEVIGGSILGYVLRKKESET